MNSIEGYVHVYRNLHKNCYSIRQRGKVIAHLPSLFLEDVSFHVQPSGRQRVIDSGKKNVHAYVKGKLSNPSGSFSFNLLDRVRYNPFDTDTFMAQDESRHWSPIHHADYLFLPEDFQLTQIRKETPHDSI